ncbi:MAG TPA: hypothetical protein VNP96_08405 [Solirubrobacterales bacterium]|nr:hypothetical protein [Solirubrobacterales bacterium]
MPSDLPADHIEIAAHQRDALYGLVVDRLSGVGDISLALDNKDYAAAERIATRFGEDFRLMRDLGWDPSDDRETVELTLPPLELMRIAKRLRDDARGGIAGLEEERDSVGPPKFIEGYRIVRETCEDILMAVLADLDPGEDEPA